MANKNLASQTETLVKDRANQADAIAKKLEEKLSKMPGAGSGFSQLKTELKELLSKGAGGGSLNEADRTFFRGLNNETKGTIQTIKEEILKINEESKF